jgi:hypothetical protein
MVSGNYANSSTATGALNTQCAQAAPGGSIDGSVSLTPLNCTPTPTPTPTPTATYTTRGPGLGNNYATCTTGTTASSGSQYVSTPSNYTVSNGSCGSVTWYAYTTGTWYYSCCQT